MKTTVIIMKSIHKLKEYKKHWRNPSQAHLIKPTVTCLCITCTNYCQKGELDKYWLCWSDLSLQQGKDSNIQVQVKFNKFSPPVSPASVSVKTRSAANTLQEPPPRDTWHKSSFKNLSAATESLPFTPFIYRTDFPE